MKRKNISKSLWICVILAVCLLFSLPAAAADYYVYDELDYISSDSLNKLEAQAQQIYMDYGIEAIFLLTDDIGGVEPHDYATEYMDSVCVSKNAIIMMDNQADETIYIDCGGTPNQYFSDEDLQAMLSAYNDGSTYSSGVAAYYDKLTSLAADYGLGVSDTTMEPNADDSAPRDEDLEPQPSSGHPCRLVDEADLLTDTEEAVLLTQLNDVSKRQQCDVVVVTSNSLEGKTSMAYADDYFDYNGYGIGANNDGVLLLVCMEDRDWWISTTGYGITAFTDAGIEYMSDAFLPSLSDGDYFSAFTTYAEYCDDFLTRARAGDPVDVGNYDAPRGAYPWFNNIFLALVIGIVLSFITVFVMKSKLKTVRFQAAASEYTKAGSLSLSSQEDHFLYSNVARTAKPKDNGGSSTHSGSSGTSHGGGGGKF